MLDFQVIEAKSIGQSEAQKSLGPQRELDCLPDGSVGERRCTLNLLLTS